MDAPADQKEYSDNFEERKEQVALSFLFVSKTDFCRLVSVEKCRLRE